MVLWPGTRFRAGTALGVLRACALRVDPLSAVGALSVVDPLSVVGSLSVVGLGALFASLLVGVAVVGCHGSLKIDAIGE
jgi:hypothetical protein